MNNHGSKENLIHSADDGQQNKVKSDIHTFSVLDPSHRQWLRNLEMTIWPALPTFDHS